MKHPSEIGIAAYNYDLPEEKIAKYPLKDRDGSKLLLCKEDVISTKKFDELPQLLPADSILVFNQSSVIRSRLLFTNEQHHQVEIFCLEPHASSDDPEKGLSATKEVLWNCIVGNLRKWKSGPLILKHESITLQSEIVEKKSGYVVIRFSWSPPETTFAQILEVSGKIPIPPYLNRDPDDTDTERYQTTYSKDSGSVAAPTAGLHFTYKVLEEIKDRNVKILNVTLHVGAGTFKPVKSEFLADHEMHSEWISVDRSTIEALSNKKNFPVIAVGTTSLRTIETLYWMGLKVLRNPNAELSELEISQWEVYEMEAENIDLKKSLGALLMWMKERETTKLICRTSILIAPPYKLRVAEGLLTNFHQPQSTLLLLVAAVIGDRWKKVYEYALKNDFRFLSYGDSSLLLK